MARIQLGGRRRRLKMEKMKNQANLQVTFSKRRNGLFKKASELCTLVGIEVAIIVFSPGNHVYSFGHPSVDTVVRRFLGLDRVQHPASLLAIEAYRNASIRYLTAYMNMLTDKLYELNKRSAELKKFEKVDRERNWWQKPLDELNKEQLQDLLAVMVEMKKKVARALAEQMSMEDSIPAALPYQEINNTAAVDGNMAVPHGAVGHVFNNNS